jgi:phage terminase large subunit-like protein
MKPLDLLYLLQLDVGKPWGAIATDWQLDDAAAFFNPDPYAPRWHFQTRPRGGSKDTDSAGVALVWLATEAKPGARGYIIAVDLDQAALMVDAAAGLVDRTPALRSILKVDSLRIISKSGASVEVLAADGPSAFGLRPDCLWINEFAQWNTTRNSRRLWTALLSAMHKVPGSRMVVMTSAGEPGHPAYKVLEEARTSSSWRVSEVPGPLPWVNQADLEAQRPLLRDSEFARLHENVWTSAEDRLVSAEDLEAAAVLDGPQAPRPGVRYILTLDVGIVRDACVVTVCHADPLTPEAGSPRRVTVDRLAVWHGSKRKPVNLSEVEDFILAASHEYHGAKLHADPYQAIELLQRLRAKGVRAEEFAFTSQSVGRVAQALHLALRNRLLLIPKDVGLLAELARVRLQETSPGVVRIQHDSGEHDDQAIAIAIGVAVLQGKTSGWTPASLKAFAEHELGGRSTAAVERDETLQSHLAEMQARVYAEQPQSDEPEREEVPDCTRSDCSFKPSVEHVDLEECTNTGCEMFREKEEAA